MGIGRRFHCDEIDPPFTRPYNPKDDPIKETASRPARQGKKSPGAGNSRNRGRVVEEGGAKYVVFEGSPYYTMHQNVDQWRFGLAQDEKVGDEALLDGR